MSLFCVISSEAPVFDIERCAAVLGATGEVEAAQRRRESTSLHHQQESPRRRVPQRHARPQQR